MNYKLWFVVEFCNGGDLNAFIAKNINNHKFNAIITKQLVKGLQFLHQVLLKLYIVKFTVANPTDFSTFFRKMLVRKILHLFYNEAFMNENSLKLKLQIKS